MNGANRAVLRAMSVAALLVLSTGASAQSQQPDQEILNELRAIRQLLEKIAGPLGQTASVPPAAGSGRVTLTSVTGYVLGKPDAPLTMIEFTDLQCPFCRQFHTTSFEQLKRDYIDAGKLRYLSRDFPLDNLHPLAIAAARTARCAADQGKFWEMRHTILVNNAHLTPEIFTAFAQDLKLNTTDFAFCMANTAQVDHEWQQDRTDGLGVGISGTPSFVIGYTTETGLEGVRIVGAQPYAAFDAKLRELLAARPPARP